MSEKMWAGRFKKSLASEVNDFNSSFPTDRRMWEADIRGSLAHVKMLEAQKIIPFCDAEKITNGLNSIAKDIESGTLPLTGDAEDIHMFIEAELTKRIGDAGKRLHTARSRNDQVALDIRLYLLDEIDYIMEEAIPALCDAISEQAAANEKTIMPGYTHLQRAQPVTMALHLKAYLAMLSRDKERLSETRRRTAISPLGSCALAGTTYPIDRKTVANELGLTGVTNNPIDGVSDRDFAVELAADLSILMMHLSRLSEEIILWCSYEFKFVELDDAYATGSSIMPQKKNPDITELIRGKTGRVYGDLMTLLTLMKGLPLAYNKDMQEDKDAIFDAVDTVKICLETFAPMIKTMAVLPENCRVAAAKGYINATDCADYLTKKGVPFRTAYKLTGEIVAYCITENLTLETMPLSKYKEFSELFEEDIFDAIKLENCAMRRLGEYVN